MEKHRPLRERETVLSSDVADALELMLSRGSSDLPQAIKRTQVVDAIIEIAHMDDDGVVQEIHPMMRRSVGEVVTNRLTNSPLFQAGYKRYEERTANPIVPVTDFFFRVVFGNGDVAGCLDAMSDHEIMHSLPKRPGIAKAEDRVTPIMDPAGEVVNSGDVAGIVIFPPNMQSRLLRAWLERRARNASGMLTKTVAAIEHARPETQAVAELKEKSAPVARAMNKALPRPKSR